MYLYPAHFSFDDNLFHYYQQGTENLICMRTVREILTYLIYTYVGKNSYGDVMIRFVMFSVLNGRILAFHFRILYILDCKYMMAEY